MVVSWDWGPSKLGRCPHDPPEYTGRAVDVAFWVIPDRLSAIAGLHPLLGEVMAMIEFVVLLLIVPGTALYGSHTLSERAFRLLRLLGNRPEPPGPSDQGRARAAGRRQR